MSRSVALLLKGLGVGLVALLGLSPLAAMAQSKPLVVVSVPVLGLIAREIGGSDIEVHQLLQGDASPHDYAMKFSDRKSLTRAQKVFWIAPTLESFLVQPLAAHEQSVPLYASLSESEAHIWFEPTLVRDSARVMTLQFSRLKPEAAAAFSARLAAFETRLAPVAQKLVVQLQALKGVQLIVGHDAYDQLTGKNGLPHALAVLQQIQTAASAQRIATLERQIGAGGSFCVIEERNHPLPVARQLAQRHGLPLVVVDVYGARASSYADWLQELGQALSGCKKKAPSGRQ
jgi:zinc transport system substrate-binding protein